MSEEINIVPTNWEIQDLGDICFTTSGGTPSRKIPSYYSGSIPWVKSGELDKGLIIKTEENISEEAVKNSSAKIFPKGTLLIALYGATIGKIGFLGVDAATNQAICGIFKNDIIDLQFLKYYLFNKRNYLIEQGAGGAQPNISQTILKKTPIPLPPLAEQRRIVAKIEELFSDLDKGIESLKTAQDQLKVYRQSVLKWAFEGKLTNKNVKDGELPDGWKWEKLLGLCDFITKGTTPPANKLYLLKGDVPFLKVYNLMFNGCLDFSINPTFVSVDTHKNMLARSKVIPGDVLMNIVGPPLGKVSIVPDLFSEWNINQAIARFRCKKALFNKYLSSFLMADRTIRTYSKKAKATAGQFNLTLEICRDIDIPLPRTLKEQQLIVSEIETRLSVCDKLEESIIQSLEQSKALRQSILKKAFEGKLVPQNPNDEPASVLLERIRAEREKSSKEKPEKRRKQ